MIFSLCARLFVPYPWYTTPDITDFMRRSLCRGWSCKSEQFLLHQVEEFDEVFNQYEKGQLVNSTLKDEVYSFMKRGYTPATCAAGFYHMLGFDTFEEDLDLSLEYLKKGADEDIWSCIELLAFHPLVKNASEYADLSIKKGGTWSIARYALQNRNITYLKHLATVMTNGWWKKRRSGSEYAKAVGTILNVTNGKDVKGAWATIDRLSHEGHLPAAIWAAEGYQTGEIGTVDENAAVDVLVPYILNSAWKIDIAAAMASKTKINLSRLLKIASQIGDKTADAILSYPFLL